MFTITINHPEIWHECQQCHQILLVEDEDFDVCAGQEHGPAVPGAAPHRGCGVQRQVRRSISFRAKPDKYDVVILDFQISGGLRGEELIRNIKEIDPLIQIIVITKMTINMTDFEFANSLLKAGAFWYCTKYPGNIEEYIYQPTDFLLSIFNAYEKKTLEKQKLKADRRLMQNIESLLEAKKIIGESKTMAQLREAIEKYARSDVNVLISGASGTGKELVAWNIHLKSKTAAREVRPDQLRQHPAGTDRKRAVRLRKGIVHGSRSP